jgi:hypothetical protein
MAPFETVEKYTQRQSGYVGHVRMRRTDDDKYPSGWNYTLHYCTAEGETLLQYDNAHEQIKDHERHVPDEVAMIEFSLMSTLLARFQREVDQLPPEN